jgi:hypothetical protein
MTRCNYIIICNNTRRYCKNFSKYLINLKGNIHLCQVHGYKIINNYANIIQKIFKGNKARTKMKIFIKLPDELQRKIIFYIREPLYLSKLNILYNKFLYHRINKINNEINFNKIIYSRYEDIYRYLTDENIKNFSNVLSLIIKYNKILTNKKIIHSINFLCNELEKIFLQCVTKNNIDNYNTWMVIMKSIRKYKKGIK